MYYSIAKTTYSCPQTEVIYNSKYFRDILEELEATVIDFLNSYEVLRRIPIFYRKSKSRQYKYVPLGYFIVKSNSFHKFTLFHKHQHSGYLYNSTQIDKIASFRITKNKNILEEPILEAKEKLFMIPSMCIITKKEGETWKKTHQLIIEKGKPKDITIL